LTRAQPGAGEAHGHFELAIEMLEHGLHAHTSAERPYSAASP